MCNRGVIRFVDALICTTVLNRLFVDLVNNDLADGCVVAQYRLLSCLMCQAISNLASQYCCTD